MERRGKFSSERQEIRRRWDNRARKLECARAALTEDPQISIYFHYESARCGT
jgi:hypothetical protein